MGDSLVRALYDYEAMDPDELTLRENDIICVLSKDPSGWWKGQCNGRIGMFPSNYTEPCDSATGAMANPHLTNPSRGGTV
ncbi:Signal transducing adapter molecule 2 [Balamuthia mandrillaris]